MFSHYFPFLGWKKLLFLFCFLCCFFKFFFLDLVVKLTTTIEEVNAIHLLMERETFLLMHSIHPMVDFILMTKKILRLLNGNSVSTIIHILLSSCLLLFIQNNLTFIFDRKCLIWIPNNFVFRKVFHLYNFYVKKLQTK